jgi:hypothetical protein
MKRSAITLLALCITFLATGQKTENQKLIELGKAYKNFMFSNEPTKDELNKIKSDVPERLKTSAAFIVQTITTKNKLLTAAYLSRPDDNVLKQIYIIAAINANLRTENQIDNNKLIDSLSGSQISAYELLDNYYDMLFIAMGNKNKPFNLSNTDLKPDEYGLKDDTEKGIMVLKAIASCGTEIWGYMNIVKPANTRKAYENIKKFPKINGRPYYQYMDFYFPDFEMKITEELDKQSYKGYYLNKFYEVLLSHLICLSKEGATEKEELDLKLGSILKENKLYKYTKYKETLEHIFELQKMKD